MDISSIRERLQDDLNRLRAPKGYLRAGEPRYATLFGRDSLISGWQTLALDPSIASSTLRVLASFQGRRLHERSEEEPGKILHEHRFQLNEQKELPEWDFPYYGSVDSTPLFLVVAAEYVAVTEDVSLVDELWPAIQAAYRWMTDFGDRDGDGYLEYARRNPAGLMHQGWKDGSEDHLRITPPVAMVEVQGYAIAAHRAYATLARARDADAALQAERAAARVQKALERDFWLPDLQFFALALDGSKKPRRAITSNPGHLLLAKAVRRELVDPIVSRLFREDMWTPFGIRNHATTEPDFDPSGYHTGTVWPHDNWFIFKGLLIHGRRREALRIRDALICVWEELGRIPELYAVVDGDLLDLSAGVGPVRANPLQAWSSGALMDMIAAD